MSTPADGLNFDPAALDRLAALFAECRELGIAIADMPLDCPDRQREAVAALEAAVYRKRNYAGRHRRGHERYHEGRGEES